MLLSRHRSPLCFSLLPTTFLPLDEVISLESQTRLILVLISLRLLNSVLVHIDTRTGFPFKLSRCRRGRSLKRWRENNSQPSSRPRASRSVSLASTLPSLSRLCLNCVRFFYGACVCVCVYLSGCGRTGSRNVCVCVTVYVSRCVCRGVCEVIIFFPACACVCVCVSVCANQIKPMYLSNTPQTHAQKHV